MFKFKEVMAFLKRDTMAKACRRTSTELRPTLLKLIQK
jgi:hypothetical protein